MFFSRKEYLSLKNGKIVVSKFLFETPSVLVKGCMQSGPYIVAMWKEAYKKIPKTYSPKKILILGLGAGNSINLLQKKYKGVAISVIEWDEVMISVARDLGVKETDTVQIIHGDAFFLIKKEQEKFDIIVIDLFSGDIPPIEITEDASMIAYQNLLEDNGYLLVNLFRHKEYIPYFKNYFTIEKVWEYRVNTLALVRKV